MTVDPDQHVAGAICEPACGPGHGLVEKKNEATESDQDRENHKDVGQVGAYYYCEQPKAALATVKCKSLILPMSCNLVD